MNRSSPAGADPGAGMPEPVRGATWKVLIQEWRLGGIHLASHSEYPTSMEGAKAVPERSPVHGRFAPAFSIFFNELKSRSKMEHSPWGKTRRGWNSQWGRRQVPWRETRWATCLRNPDSGTSVRDRKAGGAPRTSPVTSTGNSGSSSIGIRMQRPQRAIWLTFQSPAY
jgi:hypothetical protein